jgi:hypothetical protein
MTSRNDRNIKDSRKAVLFISANGQLMQARYNTFANMSTID